MGDDPVQSGHDQDDEEQNPGDRRPATQPPVLEPEDHQVVGDGQPTLPRSSHGVVPAEQHERLVKKRAVEVLDQEVTLPERVNRLAFSLRVANEDMALISQRYSRGFFIDDGLCHNFTRVLLELLEQDDSDAETLVRARAFVVFLVDEPDFVVENILARRKNTKQFRGNNFPSLGRSELRRLCADRDRDCRKMLAVLSRAGCNKLILRAENGIETNAREIRAFEQKLVNGGPHARTDVTASPAGRPLD